MQLPSPLHSGSYLRRYKRFFADVRLQDGTTVVAHCANSGTMKGCLIPEGRVWLSRNDDPKRKLRYTWELAQVDDALVFLHPVSANGLVREAIENGVITELAGYSELQAECRAGENTRFDFLLRQGTDRHFVEVKSVTLALSAGRTAFPDAVSTRATKHLRELVAQVKAGNRASLVFCASRTDAQSVEPAGDIDPVYADALRWAATEGVQVLAYRISVELNHPSASVTLSQRIPVVLNP